MRDPRIIFGFCFLFVLFALGVIIGIGHVAKDSSYGLEFILGGLSSGFGIYIQWLCNGKPDGK